MEPFFVKGICRPSAKMSTLNQEIRSGGASPLFASAMFFSHLADVGKGRTCIVNGFDDGADDL